VRFAGEVEQFQSKGDSEVMRIDIDSLETMLGNLRNHCDDYIKHLTGSTKEHFDQMVDYVHILYDSNSYHVLYDLVKKHFGDLNHVHPGTVGAYFGGCIGETSGSVDIPGCSVVCAGSMPQPKDVDNWSFCNYTVIWGQYADYKFHFSELHHGEEYGYAVVFVNFWSNHSFPGLSDYEKDQIKKMGVEYVVLMGYGDDGKDYTELTDGAVPLDHIKPRVHVEPVKNDKDGVNALLLILIIVIILLIIFAGWRSFSY